MKICFLTKKEKKGVDEAIQYTYELSENVDVFYGDLNIPIPEKVYMTKYDILISYISPWIVPPKILNNTNKWNINFHPGPPAYPGIGCFNFAIYNSEDKFGATAHIMQKKVDSGQIIGVEYFSMTNEETVETLSIKTYNAQLILYKNIINHIKNHDRLPSCIYSWERKPYRRIDLEELSKINIDMPYTEIQKRIRATYYPGKPAPFIKIGTSKFEYNPNR